MLVPHFLGLARLRSYHRPIHLGSGFLGQHIVDALQARGDNVATFDVVRRHFDVPFPRRHHERTGPQHCHPEGKMIILLHLDRKRKLSVANVAAPNA